jgi:hypothetical protein
VLIFPLSILFNDQNVKFKTDSDDSAFLVKSSAKCQRSVDCLFCKRVKLWKKEDSHQNLTIYRKNTLLNFCQF